MEKNKANKNKCSKRGMNYFVNMTQIHMLASVPKKYADTFRDHLFFFNNTRMLIQSAIVVLVNIGLLLTHFFSQPHNVLKSSYLAALVIQCLIMIVVAAISYRISLNGIVVRKPSENIVAMFYVIVYLLTEFAIFMLSFQGIGSFLRLIAITFITGNVIVLHQKKSCPIFLLFYLAIYLVLPYLQYSSFIYPYISSYNFWLACACSMLTSIGVYSWYINQFLSDIVIQESNEKQVQSNSLLQEEIRHRAKYLGAVNDISRGLLNAETINFESVLFRSMEKLGAVVGVQHICLWKNEVRHGQIYCLREYEWEEGSKAFNDNSNEPYYRMPEEWERVFSTFNSLNVVIDELPEEMKAPLFEQLNAKDVISAIIIPISLHDSFWGFVGFADCKNKRHFSETEEEMLKTISLLYATSMIHNQTTLDLLESTRKALSNSKAKSAFLANMSHEIRTPINAITGMLTLAQRAKSVEETYSYLERIDTASAQLLAIINDVLDISKIEAGKIELAEIPFEIRATLYNIDSIFRVQTNQKGISFDVDFRADLPDVVVADEIRLSQILINLLSNAVKFTPEGGEIRFSARLVAKNSDGFDELEFVVQDNGIGIAKENQSHLFDAFEQAENGISREFGGTGLGLAISKCIAEMMDGSIILRSELGKGTRFIVRLFIKEGVLAMLDKPKIEDDKANCDFTGVSALLVEDVEINREIAIAILSDTGLEIDVAENGRIAVDMISEKPEKYDIVFMDLQMPVMDGITATEKIRAIKSNHIKDLPIIAMSANAFAEDVRKCINAGMNDHVAKPIDYQELITKITHFV